MFIYGGLMKNAFDFLAEDSDASAVGNIAFGIAILFAVMALVTCILGTVTGICTKNSKIGTKCETCCAVAVSPIYP